MGTLGWRKGKWIKPRSETLSDMFKIKMCVSETSELTKRQLSAQTENKMVGGGAGDKISKLCAGQATKMCWRMALPSLYGHTGMEKRLMDEVQKRKQIVRNL